MNCLPGRNELPSSCSILNVKRKYPASTNLHGGKCSNEKLSQRKKRKRRGGCIPLQAEHTCIAVSADEINAAATNVTDVKVKSKKKRHNKSVKRRKLRESSSMILMGQNGDPFTNGFPMGGSEKLRDKIKDDGLIPYRTTTSSASYGGINDDLITAKKSNDSVGTSDCASDAVTGFEKTHLNEGSLISDFSCIQVKSFHTFHSHPNN